MKSQNSLIFYLSKEEVMRLALSSLAQAIDRRRTHQYVYLHTGEIIAEANGMFLSDLETPVMHSDNAEIGRMLQANSTFLRIKHEQANVPVVDSNGHRTHASLWRIEPILTEACGAVRDQG
ncbi:hypothetical protein [Paraburkholderia sp. DGU8]|uniref:hypothetical protein n=1 Tax=Paraburkholderia sp. DGU8 TaxID=3161997 RepID=UPI003467BF06